MQEASVVKHILTMRTLRKRTLLSASAHTLVHDGSRTFIACKGRRTEPEETE